MADKSLFGRLSRLFSTNIIVRNIGGRRLKVADTSRLQSSGNLSSNYMVDRWAKLHRGSGYGSGAQQTNYTVARRVLFDDYEAMDQDPILSSALDIYSDECTVRNEFGNILEITSTNDNIQEILNNLFYDILNIDFNLWPWIRNLVKYGDHFMKLDISEKYGIVNVNPISPYEMERVEEFDTDVQRPVMFFHEGEGQKHEYENYEIAHFRLLSDTNFLPYGKSMIEAARKIWKQLMLMEDAMLLHRIMRAPEKRVFKIDIGNIPPAEVDTYMNSLISKMKKTPFIDQATGDYNLKYNIQNMLEDFYLPVRGGDTGTSIENLAGLENNSIDDIEYLKNKMLAALKIPKAFLGYEEGVEGKSTLAQEDVRFARTIERIQRIVESELYKIAIVHLYAQGYKDEELVNFDLALTNPSIVYEQEKIELWNNKQSLASDLKDLKMVSEDWVYGNIFNMSTDQVKKERERVIEDIKRKFRHDQIEAEGNDPVSTGQSFGTPHDLAMVGAEGQKEQGQGADEEPGDYDSDDKVSIFAQDNRGAPKGGHPGAGRPKKGAKYKTDRGVKGRDPIGAKQNKSLSRDKTIKHTYNGSPMRDWISKRKTKAIITETMKNALETPYNDKGGLLDEKNLISDEPNVE